MEPSLALGILEEKDYFNPHLLVKNDFKRRLRTQFFRQLLASTRIFEMGWFFHRRKCRKGSNGKV